MPELHPYNPAVLVHHNYDVSRRWFVQFWAWNETTQRKERYRMFKPLNYKKHSLQKRLELAEQMVRIINGQLAAGKVLGKKTVAQVTNNNVAKLTVVNAIKYVTDQKKKNGNRKSYYRSFDTVVFNLDKWLDFTKQPDFPLRDFTREDAVSFFNFLRDERKISNKYINTIVSNFRTAINFIEAETDQNIFKRNPLKKLPKLPVVTKFHAVYTNEQINLIKKEISHRIKTAPVNRRLGYKQLQLFISFVYYLHARPNEIEQVRVGDINLADNRVIIQGEVSKVKTDFYVEIPAQLMQIIIDSGIMNYPPEYLVFSKTSTPGPLQVHDNYFWERHNSVLKKLGLLKVNPNFTLYGYKHSAAASLYLATKDIKLVQRQCRHQTLEQTNTYLRDLGVLADYNQLTPWKGAV